GGVFGLGNTGFFGSTGSLPLRKPIVGVVATPDRKGYWLVAADGGVFAFGNTGYYGSAASLRLSKPRGRYGRDPGREGLLARGRRWRRLQLRRRRLLRLHRVPSAEQAGGRHGRHARRERLLARGRRRWRVRLRQHRLLRLRRIPVPQQASRRYGRRMRRFELRETLGRQPPPGHQWSEEFDPYSRQVHRRSSQP